MEPVARLPEWLPLVILLAVLSSFLTPSKRRWPRGLRRLPSRKKAKPRLNGAIVSAEPVTEIARKRFLTEAEARVLRYLEAALPQHRVMAQVAMGALLNANKRNRWQWYATRNRFAQKIVDFAIVTRDTAAVVALVELDDWSHDESRDALRDAMTDAAGYRTIRIPGNPRPTAESVRAAVTDLAHAYRAGPWRAGSQAASPEARRVME